MRVEHIVWSKPEHEVVLRGLLKIKYGFHGDDYAYEMIVEGSFDTDNEKLYVANREFVISYVAYMRVKEVGTICRDVA